MNFLEKWDKELDSEWGKEYLEELRMDVECFATFIKKKMFMELAQVKEHLRDEHNINTYYRNKINYWDWQELSGKEKQVVFKAMADILGVVGAERHIEQNPCCVKVF